MKIETAYKHAKNRFRDMGYKLSEFKTGELGGAYSGQLGVIEYALHEMAHLVTLGYDYKTLPKKCSFLIDKHFANMSGEAGDILEIETSRITYEVLSQGLELVSNPDKIIESCDQALFMGRQYTDKNKILNTLRQRMQAPLQPGQHQQSQELYKWFVKK